MKRSDINAIESAARDVAHWGAVVEDEWQRISERGLTVSNASGGKGYLDFIAASRRLREALKKLPRHTKFVMKEKANEETIRQ